MSNDKKTSENGHDNAGRFAPGNPGGPGRPLGTPNKVTATMRDLVERSVHERNPDGALAWLNSLPDSLFIRLADKLLPHGLAADVGADRGFEIKIINYARKRATPDADEDAEIPMDIGNAT